MQRWHVTPDSPRMPLQPRAGDGVVLHIGTWPNALTLGPFFSSAQTVTFRFECGDS